MSSDAHPMANPAGVTSLDQMGVGRAATVVGAGMMAMNAFAYAFVLLAAHSLGPSSFGGVGALLGVLIVANVGSVTLQATAARRLATSASDELSAVRRDVLRTGRGMAAAFGIVLLLVVPLLDKALQLDDWVATSMVALACTALTMMGAYAGLLQGERRWAALALLYLSMGLGRIVAGGVALLVDESLRSAMVGVAVGSLLPLVVGQRLCPMAGAEHPTHRSVVGELWRNGHTLLAFFAFTNLDVLLARHLFSSHDAGIYAGGAILTKACLFLPTFVLVAAFPAMAADRTGRAWVRPLLLVLGLGGCAVLGALLLPGLAEAFAGGHEYVGLGHLAWLFALEGTLFAALQILVYDTIAGQSHSASLLWGGVVAVAVVGSLVAHSVEELAAIATATAVLVGALVCATRPRLTPPVATDQRGRRPTSRTSAETDLR